jgi:hypothetical protein
MIILRYDPTPAQSKELTKVCNLHGIKWTQSDDPIEKNAPVLIITEGIPSSKRIIAFALTRNFINTKIAVLLLDIMREHYNEGKARLFTKKAILHSIGDSQKCTEEVGDMMTMIGTWQFHVD